MKRTFSGILTFLFILTSLALAQPPATSPDTTRLKSMAEEFVSQMAKGDFAAATANFDSTMKATMTPDKLAETWKSLTLQVGEFKQSGGTRVEKMGPYNIVFATTEFAQMPLDIRVVFDNAGKIAGIQATQVTPAVQYKTAPYVNFRSFKESEVEIGSGKWAVQGTMTKPTSTTPVPALVLVHGSGPLDRDETVGPNKPFRDLAWGLATQGIAVLRYDKRTLTHGQEMGPIMDSITVKEETIDDVISAVNLLRQTPGIDSSKVFVLGHSLGGTLAPRIGKIDPSITGFIIMAGMTRPIEDAIVSQYDYILSLDSTLSPADRAAVLDSIKQAAQKVKDPTLSKDTPSSELLLGVPASYWLDLRNYKPAEVAKTVKRPMLILQGGRDYQVTAEDFDGWKKALSGRKDVEFKFYPDMNHLFQKGEGKSTPDEYAEPGNVDKSVIDDIAGWIKAH